MNIYSFSRVAMTLLVAVLTTTVWAETVNGVKYIDQNGVEQTRDNVIVLEGTEKTLGTEGQDTWYVVNKDISYTEHVEDEVLDIFSTLTLQGYVHIILADDKTMTITSIDEVPLSMGILILNGDLTIYGQRNGSGTLAIDAFSGIAGEQISLTINGGNIVLSLYSAHDYPGIGITLTNGFLTINNGHVIVQYDPTSPYAQGMTAGFVVATEIHSRRDDGYDFECSSRRTSSDAAMVIINGGVIDISCHLCMLVENSVTINGGQVTLYGDRNVPFGAIYTNGAVTLGWTNVTDFVKSTGYTCAEIIVPDGKTLCGEDGSIYNSGTYTNEGIDAFAGKKIMPVAGVTFATESEQLTATLDGTSGGVASIPTDISVKGVALERTFTSGVASTVMLPFEIAASSVAGGTFYTFNGVAYDESEQKWVADMTQEATTVAANKPYMFLPTAAQMTFNLPTDGVTLNTTADCYSTNSGEWTFTGTYTPLTFGSNLTGTIFGFAGTPQAADEGVDAVEAGAFVKAGTGANIPPFRAYLTYSGSDEALQTPIHHAATTAPNLIVVRLHNADGHVTSIDGQLTVKDENAQYYTLDGRLVNGQPTQKGVYVKNGKKVVIK